jgi:hypothetical protein
MTNQVSSFPATANPAPLRRYGGVIASLFELPIHPLGDFYEVEGSGTVLSLPSWPKGPPVILRCLGSPTLVHSNKLRLPGNQSFTFSIGDTAWVFPLGDGAWREAKIRQFRPILVVSALRWSSVRWSTMIAC